MKSKPSPRGTSGAALIEGVAAVCLILPMMVFLIAVIIEVNSVMSVKATLSEAARLGARNCALAYHWPPFGTNEQPHGDAYSPDAQGDLVAPPTTSGGEPAVSPTVTGTESGGAAGSGQPRCANDAWRRVRFGLIVCSNTQFSAVYTPASVNAAGAPQLQCGHVTVTVKSRKGLYPAPDPLSLRRIFGEATITSSATYGL